VGVCGLSFRVLGCVVDGCGVVCCWRAGVGGGGVGVGGGGGGGGEGRKGGGGEGGGGGSTYNTFNTYRLALLPS